MIYQGLRQQWKHRQPWPARTFKVPGRKLPRENLPVLLVKSCILWQKVMCCLCANLYKFKSRLFIHHTQRLYVETGEFKLCAWFFVFVFFTWVTLTTRTNNIPLWSQELLRSCSIFTASQTNRPKAAFSHVQTSSPTNHLVNINIFAGLAWNTWGWRVNKCNA